MERFIGRVAIFGAVVAGVILSLFLIMGRRSSRPEHFKVREDARTLFIGHSHMAYGIKDSLVRGTENLAMQGECYFYSYFKLRTLLAANPGVDQVIIDASNNQFTERMDEWIWSDRFLQENYPHYAIFMEPSEHIKLFLHNPAAVASSLSEALRDQVAFSLSGSKDYYGQLGIKGYRIADRVMTAPGGNTYTMPQRSARPSEDNLKALADMIGLCRSRGIDVKLLRLPLYVTSDEHQYDSLLTANLRTRFPGTAFIDMNALDLPVDCYLDAEHANTRGATIISGLIDGFLHADLKDAAGIQGWLNQRIPVVNDSVARARQKD